MLEVYVVEICGLKHSHTHCSVSEMPYYLIICDLLQFCSIFCPLVHLTCLSFSLLQTVFVFSMVDKCSCEI